MNHHNRGAAPREAVVAANTIECLLPEGIENAEGNEEGVPEEDPLPLHIRGGRSWERHLIRGLTDRYGIARYLSDLATMHFVGRSSDLVVVRHLNDGLLAAIRTNRWSRSDSRAAVRALLTRIDESRSPETTRAYWERLNKANDRMWGLHPKLRTYGIS